MLKTSRDLEGAVSVNLPGMMHGNRTAYSTSFVNKCMAFVFVDMMRCNKSHSEAITRCAQYMGASSATIRKWLHSCQDVLDSDFIQEQDRRGLPPISWAMWWTAENAKLARCRALHQKLTT